MESNGRKYVVATFLVSLFCPDARAKLTTRFKQDIPANNCVILQRGDELERLPAGQHVITHPNVSLSASWR